MLRAVERLRPYLLAYDYCSNGSHEDNEATSEKLSTIVEIAHEVGRFDETVLFRGENANVSLNVSSEQINMSYFPDSERGIQGTFPQRISYHGLCWL